ncbi:MAG TPA: heavy metal-binding domain-containing protein [Chitinophagaceae bacterium]|nr:heavy metal-binding domain-containing protein [Chitinophagaceae bacterium]
MKTIIMALAVLLFAGTATIAQTKHSSKHKKHVTVSKKYTCPMHPEVIRSKPGKCPKCGMKLVAVKKK